MSDGPRKPDRAAAPAKQEHYYDPLNEAVVIRAAIADAAVRARHVRSVASDEFLVPAHATIWRAKRRMLDDGVVEYSAEVMARYVVDEGGDETTLATLRELEATAEVPSNLDWHVATMRWDAQRARALAGPVPALIEALRDPKASADHVAGLARAVAKSVDGEAARRFIRRPDELRRGYTAELDVRAATQRIYPTGFAGIDSKVVEGLAPKKTHVIAGLSGSGKSTWTSELVIRQAKMGRRVLWGVWEQGSYSTLDIAVAQLTQIDIKAIVQGSLSADELKRVKRATWWLTDRVKFMDNAFFAPELRRGKRTNERCLDVLEGYIAESGCDVVVYDLWERMLVDLSFDGVTTALYQQQNMHERYDVCGLLVHQMRGKDVERRPDKRPTREGIKGVGAFVEVADCIWGVHRDAQFKRVADDTIEIINLKQRKGEAFWAYTFEWYGRFGGIVGHGKEVSYDPGLENAEGFGDIGDIKTGGRAKKKPGRSRE